MLLFRPAAPVAALLLLGAAGAAAADRSPDDLIEAVRAGGHVIFVRHAATETDYADQVSAVMGDCSTQRMLGREGWAQARALGAAFRRHGVPVGAVVSSEYCRAWQTADLAFGRFETSPALNFEPAEDYSPDQTERMRARMTALLAAPPPAGVNTVLIGHDDPFEAATGLYPEPMGVTVVLRPDGAGGFEILGSIAPDAWPAPGG